MKLKLLALSVLPFLLLSCNSRNGNGGGNGGTKKFKDANINAAVNLGKDKQDQLRKAVHDYQMDCKIILDDQTSTLSPSSYYEELDKLPVYGVYSASYDKQEFNVAFNDSLSLNEGVKKEGNKYIGTGFFADFTDQNQDYLKKIYDFYLGDWIYSFGLIDSLRSLYSSDFNVNLGSSGESQMNINMSASISDTEWYNKVICTKSEGEGNLTIGLSEPIEYTERISINTSYEGASYKMTEDITLKFDYLEGKYVDYRIDYEIIKMTMTVMIVDYPTEIPEEYRTLTYHFLQLDKYSYNTGK